MPEPLHGGSEYLDLGMQPNIRIEMRMGHGGRGWMPWFPRGGKDVAAIRNLVAFPKWYKLSNVNYKREISVLLVVLQAVNCQAFLMM